MKLKALILFTSIFLGLTGISQAYEVDLKSLNYSELELVLDNVYEASFEFDSYFKVTIEEVNQNQVMSCVLVKAKELEKRIWTEVKKFQSYYPDEDLPFTTAKSQLLKLISASEYQKCETIVEQELYSIVVQTFISKSSKISFILEFERKN
ncbi:MAG: hypothetical protein HN576_01600 [Bacteriovoracaceae bacterium]|jgi:hypothetical protein|nr:hypothetical protein [Bacteriovoracaceae bacterium]